LTAQCPASPVSGTDEKKNGHTRDTPHMVRTSFFIGGLNEPTSPLPPDRWLSVPEHLRSFVIRPLLLHR